MSTRNMHIPVICWIFGSIIVGLGVGILMKDEAWSCIVVGISLMCLAFISMLIKIGDRL